MPRIPGLRVVRSSIHGYGVVATRAFAAGELINEIDGVLVADDDIDDDTYCLLIDDGWLLDMTDQTRYINHSCEPNVTVASGLGGPDGYWAEFRALRAIETGEELFFHYAFDPEVAEPCACGTPSCRGWIIDPDAPIPER